MNNDNSPDNWLEPIREKFIEKSINSTTNYNGH